MVLRWKAACVCLVSWPLVACTAEPGEPEGDGQVDGGSGGSSADTLDRSDPTVCIPGVPRTSQLPRLTRVQYDNTIRDLLGIDNRPSTMLAPDTTGSVDQRAWDGYRLAAASLSAEVLGDAALRSRLIPCSPEGEGEACALQLIEELGRRAFRRPLTEEEVGRFQSLFARRGELTASGTFEEAAALIIEAFLSSPSFLMRSEISERADGEVFLLSSYEVASRLSYMLWGSMPDELLFEAAQADELATSEQILVQARRMLADPKARETVRRFHEHYLHMGPGTRWASISRDPAVFPDFDEAMVPLLSQETERFVEHVVFEEAGTFQDLLTAPVGFVNATLAPLYDLDPASYGEELVPVDLDPATRSGLFTRLGFLASHSLYDRSSPILRGAFIQKDVLCTPIGAPPPDAESAPLPTDGLTTNRARVDAQTEPAGCKGCHHSFINPTGFALETYDAIGAYQDTESFSGAPIDAAAKVFMGSEEVDVDGPVELFRAIADAPAAQACYARKWVQFAYERELTNEDSCAVEALAARLTEGGYTVLDLIADLTQSDYFRYRAVEVGP